MPHTSPATPLTTTPTPTQGFSRMVQHTPKANTHATTLFWFFPKLATLHLLQLRHTMATRPAQPVTPPPVRSNGNPPKLKPKKRRPADSPSRPHIDGPCVAMQAFLRGMYSRLAELPPAMSNTGKPAKDMFENMTVGVGGANVIKIVNDAFNDDLHVLVSETLYNYMTTELAANADACAPNKEAVLPEATRMSGAYTGYVRLHLSDVGPSVPTEIRRAVLGGLFAGSSFSRAPQGVQSVEWIGDNDDEYSADVTNVGDGSVKVTLDVDGESYDIFLGSKCRILLVVLHHEGEECSLF